MEPRIKHDDYVLFTIDKEINSGDTVIVNNEWGLGMVKRYHIKDGEHYLVSENPEYPPVKANEQYRVIGKVVRVWRDIKI